MRTPTDIIGQHIHLVKFDVMAADGAANGWNYEDGTFAPEETRQRIAAINATGGLVPFGGGPGQTLTAQAHPVLGGALPNGQNIIGARTTVQSTASRECPWQGTSSSPYRMIRRQKR